MRTKGEGSVKSNTEEPGGGAECKMGASQSEPRPMRSLMGVRTEEATPTLSRVDWEVPPQGPLFKVAEGPRTARAVPSDQGIKTRRRDHQHRASARSSEGKPQRGRRHKG